MGWSSLSVRAKGTLWTLKEPSIVLLSGSKFVMVAEPLELLLNGSVVWHRYAIDSQEPIPRRTFAPYVVGGRYFAFYRALGTTQLQLTEDGASERPPIPKDVWGIAGHSRCDGQFF